MCTRVFNLLLAFCKMTKLAKEKGCEIIGSGSRAWCVYSTKDGKGDDFGEMVIAHQSPSQQTQRAFHSVVIQFAPKHTAFSFIGMKSR